MIEKKLQQAASSLPEYCADFAAVEARAEEAHFRPRFRPRLALVCMLALLLVGCMSVTVPEYHLYNGNWWQFIPGFHFDPADTFDTHGKSTMKTAEELGIILPETLGEYPIIDFSQFNLTTKKVPLWYSWLNPHYQYYATYYGIEMEEPYMTDDGHEGTRHWREGAELIYGSTENDIWRRQFGYDEQNIFFGGNSLLANHQVEEITSLEYEGFTVYTGKITASYSRSTSWWNVTWVDEGKGVVFSFDSGLDTPDQLIEFAKEIIDLNK